MSGSEKRHATYWEGAEFFPLSIPLRCFPGRKLSWALCRLVVVMLRWYLNNCDCNPSSCYWEEACWIQRDLLLAQFVKSARIAMSWNWCSYTFECWDEKENPTSFGFSTLGILLGGGEPQWVNYFCIVMEFTCDFCKYRTLSTYWLIFEHGQKVSVARLPKKKKASQT